MASIAGSNALYFPYRNSVVGKTSEYPTRVDCDSDILYGFFSDDGTVTPLDSHVFHASYDTSENPDDLAAVADPGSRLQSVTAGVVGAGVVDADNLTFDGTTVLTGATNQESFIIAKFITNTAASPVLAHFGATGTGLPLTPNGAAVTVAFSTSGIWRF